MLLVSDLNLYLNQCMKKYPVTAVSIAIINGDVISDNICIDDELSHSDLTEKQSQPLSTLPYLFQGCSFSKCMMSFVMMLLTQQGYYNQLILCPENNKGIVIMTNSAAAKPLVLT